MKNWVVKLLVLLFIPSLAGILFTVAPVSYTHLTLPTKA